MSGYDELLRPLAPQALGVLLRRYGDFDSCEDAVQEAMIAALAQWPVDGTPAHPLGWLITVAARRRIEMLRGDLARRRREQTAAALDPIDPVTPPAQDDTLALYLLCCHPGLSPAAQVSLTLRAVGGLSTAEIARALMVAEPTVGQRISRAKQQIKSQGIGYEPPSPDRIHSVLQVLYLIFNEGYTASSGDRLHRVELSAEAIRLARQLRQLLPADGEVAGLLALMLLTDARRPARTGPDGTLIPLAEQDRARWDHGMIAEGAALINEALGVARIGPYQVQAAIAALHDEARRAADTDWPQILRLYDLLRYLTPGPMVTLGRIVALAMAVSPQAALTELATAEAAEPALAEHHRLFAVRAHLLELAGDQEAARAGYRQAARRTLSLPERRYLEGRAAR